VIRVCTVIRPRPKMVDHRDAARRGLRWNLAMRPMMAPAGLTKPPAGPPNTHEFMITAI
jgi:hypothetical protein